MSKFGRYLFSGLGLRFLALVLGVAALSGLCVIALLWLSDFHGLGR
jgi:hypothetical protein